MCILLVHQVHYGQVIFQERITPKPAVAMSKIAFDSSFNSTLFASQLSTVQQSQRKDSEPRFSKPSKLSGFVVLDKTETYYRSKNVFRSVYRPIFIGFENWYCFSF
jgi:hypothetical protein